MVRHHYFMVKSDFRGKALRLEVDYSAISNYELGTREPPLPVLLNYARLVGISTDMLIDDNLDLPEHLPVKSKHKRIMKRARTDRST